MKLTEATHREGYPRIAMIWGGGDDEVPDVDTNDVGE